MISFSKKIGELKPQVPLLCENGWRMFEKWPPLAESFKKIFTEKPLKQKITKIKK